MTLTREQALALHREMWTDMLNTLGETPTQRQRAEFKRNWCKSHGYSPVEHSCFLCELVIFKDERYCQTGTGCDCVRCPIVWTKNDWKYSCPCENGGYEGVDWRFSNISEVLALSEREEDN